MKVSIVTVCFNAAATIADTLASVVKQTHPDVEHLIIDGGSTDRTHDIVRGNGSRDASFLSEPDAGLYDAMNKGLRQATGDVIAYLNADDWYAAPDCVSQVVAAFDAKTDLVHGDLQMVEPQSPHRVRRVWRDRQRSRQAFAWGWQPAHPATFMRTDLLRRVGGFDTRYRLAADYAMFARCFVAEQANPVHLPMVIANMRLGGLSSAGWRAVWRGNVESLQALREVRVPWPRAAIALKLARKAFQLRVGCAPDLDRR